MGLVYRARHLGLNRLVALKLIRDVHMDSPEAEQRFQIEAQAAAKLHHPNVVPIYEFGRVETQRYLSMQLVEGESLVQHLRGMPLDGRKVASLMATLGHAVHHAHQRGVIHRDLKPANVLIDAQERPHITDFGCARFTDQSSVLTQPLDVLGSPNYMAPEQAVGGSSQVTTAADVYSLGAIMYELLCGRAPFRAATPMETLRKVMEEDPISPQKLYRFADPELEAICLKCMEKLPRQRYSSAEAMAEDLERWLRGEPILARAVTPLKRLSKWARRKPRVAALVLSLQVVALAGLAGILWMNARSAAIARESHLRLLRMHVATGNRLVEQKDHFEGLLWLTDALRMEDSDPVRIENHRYRIGAVLRHSPRLEQVLFHGEWIVGLAFSPDGNRVLTGGSDRTARVWDTRTGELVLPLMTHASRVEVGQFSADGKRLLTMDRGGAARVWDAATGAPITPPMTPDDFNSSAIETSVRKLTACARFSPEGDRVLTAWGSKAAHLWDAANGRHLLALPHKGIVNHAEFSPDGRYIVTSGSDQMARVWNGRTGQPVASPLAHDQFVAWANFSSNGRKLLTVSGRKAVHLWDWSAGRELVPRMMHGDVVFQACFSPDGRQVLTAGWDMTARIWDAATGLGTARFYHPAGLDGAVFSPDGRRIATACFDGSARVWDVERSDQPLACLPAGAPVEGVSFSPDGQRLAVASWNGTLHLWNLLEEGSLLRTFQQPKVVLAQFNVDGSRILAMSTGESRSVRAWDTATGTALGPPLDQPGPVRTANFSRDGKSALTASDDGTARLQDVVSGQDLIPPLQHPAPVSDAVFSRDEQSIITACDDRQVRVWERTTGKARLTLAHPYEVTSLAVSPMGSLLATGCRDGSVRVWDTVTGKNVAPPMTNSGAVMQVRFSDDGERLVAAYESPGRSGGSARVWDVRTGKEVGVAMRHNDDVVTAEFSPDGRSVVTASADRSVRVWDARTGRPISPPLWHRGALLQAVFSPDSRRMASLTEDGDLRLWDATTGEPITPCLRHPRESDAGSLAFSPDGKRLLIATGADEVFLREFTETHAEPEDLVLQAQALSAHRIEPTGGIVALGNAGLSNAWQTLHRPAKGAK